MNMTKKHTALENACRLVGGQTEMARLLGVTLSAVNHWVLGRRPIPSEQCPKIEKATNRGVTCEELRPDVDWAYLRGSVPKPESTAEPDKPRVLSCSAKNVLVIEPVSRKEDRRQSERRNGDRRRNSNGGGRRVAERRVRDRRVNDRRG